MKRNVRVYLQDMHDSMLKALEYTEGLDYEAFAADSKTNYAVVRCLEIIGEAAKNVPDQVRNDYPEIPWRQMAGMRDKIAHHYCVLKTTAYSGGCTRQLGPSCPLSSPFRGIQATRYAGGS